MKRLALIIMVFASAAVADSNLPPAYWANRQLPDARQEAKAEALMEELRCLVCQGQSIADSDAELAGDMRDLVRRRIATGEQPAAWPLWLAPLALLGIGAWLIHRRIRTRART